MSKSSSNTFYGKDVFAKTTATIDNSEFESIGKPVNDISNVDNPKDIVVRIHHFGNIITNIKPIDKDRYKFKLNEGAYEFNYFKAYDEGKGTFLITGSNNTLEISKKNGNANKELNLKVGDKIEIL